MSGSDRYRVCGRWLVSFQYWRRGSRGAWIVLLGVGGQMALEELVLVKRAGDGVISRDAGRMEFRVARMLDGMGGGGGGRWSRGVFRWVL